MDRVEQIIITLQTKIKQLVEENQQLKHHVLELTKQSSEYRKLSEDREESLKKLESKSQAVTAARQIEGKTDSDKVKVRIDELVREIDRCINLLNR
jgi:DNA repair ATPase RecN